MTTAEEILQENTEPREPIKAFGRDMFVRDLPLADHKRLMRMVSDFNKDQGEIPDYAAICQMGLEDEQGNLVFKPEHVAGLAKKSGRVLQDIAINIIKANCVTAETVAVEKKD